MVDSIMRIIGVVLLVSSLALLPIAQAGHLNQRDKNLWVANTVIPDLLRFDVKTGHRVSADLSNYVQFHCSGEGKGRTCSLDQSDLEDSSLSVDTVQSPKDDSLIQYATSVALYAIIAVVAALLVILLTALYLVVRVCCCIVRRCCAKRTKKPPQTPGTLQAMAWVSASLLLILILTLVVLIALAYAYGVRHAFEGISAAADAPYGFANMTYSVSRSLQPAIITVVSTVLLPTLRRANVTVNSAIRWDSIISDLVTLNRSINSIPTLSSMEETILQIQNTTDGINTQLEGIFEFASNFTERKYRIGNATDVILSDLRDLNASLVNIIGATRDAYGTVVQMDGYMYELFGPGGPGNYSVNDRDGSIDSVQYDLQRIRRSDVPGEGIPTTETLESAATGPTASLARLLSGDLYGQPNEMGDMIVKLEGIYESIVLLPNFARTADTLGAINATFREMLAPNGVAAVLPEQIQELKDAVETVPSPQVLKRHVQEVFDAVAGFDSTPLVVLLNRTNTLLHSIPPNIESILQTIDDVVVALESTREPMYDLVIVQTREFDRRIMELPINATEIYSDFEEAIGNGIDSANEVTPELRELNATITEEVDIPSLIDQIEEAQAVYDEKLGAVNRTALFAALDLAGGFNITYDTTAYEAALDNARESIAAVQFPPELTEGLQALQAVRLVLEEALRDAVGQVGDVGSDGAVNTRIGDYRLLVQGVCTDDRLQYCASNADCGAFGVCAAIAFYRCSADGGPPEFCAQDADCSGDAYCLADASRALNLQVALIALAQPEATELGQDEALDELNNVRAATQGVDLSSMRGDLDNLVADLDTIDTVPYEEEIATLRAELFNPDYSVDQYVDELRDAQDRITEVNFTDYIVQVRDVRREILEQKAEYGEDLNEYTGLAYDLRSYFFDNDTLRARLEDLERTELQQTLEQGGASALLLDVAGTLQGSANDVIDLLSNTSIAEDQERIEITDQLDEPAEYLDRFTANPHRGFHSLYTVGSLYYMLQLTNETADLIVDADDTTQDTVLYDIHGDRYPEDRLCVTRSCFQNQQDEVEGDYGRYLPLMLVPLAVVVLVALCNFGCVFVPPKQVGCWRRCMPHWLLCVIIVILPWYLIFSGFFFAFTIGLSDSCRAYPQITANFVSAYGDDLCIKLSGNNGTLSDCPVTSNNITVVADLRAMTETALGVRNCPINAGDDPFGEPLRSVASQLPAVAEWRTREELSKGELEKLRPAPRAIAFDFSGNASAQLADFLDETATDQLNCETVQAAVEQATSPVCYSVVGPWTWIMGTIYLAAWVMCCLGIPAGCALSRSFDSEAYAQRRAAQGAGWYGGRWDGDGAGVRRNMLQWRLLALRGRGPLARRGAAGAPKRAVGDAAAQADDEGREGGPALTTGMSGATQPSTLEEAAEEKKNDDGPDGLDSDIGIELSQRQPGSRSIRAANSAAATPIGSANIV